MSGAIFPKLHRFREIHFVPFPKQLSTTFEGCPKLSTTNFKKTANFHHSLFFFFEIRCTHIFTSIHQFNQGENLLENPYKPPNFELNEEPNELEYVGFWARVGASLIDTIILLVVIYPILFAIYGKEYFSSEQFLAGFSDFFLSYVFPAIAIIVFWIYKSATPGKMVIRAKIVDARTGNQPSTGQLIGRYFAYYLSLIPLGLGYLWVAWDSKKQGWHDKLAGTVVVRPISRGTEAVKFED